MWTGPVALRICVEYLVPKSKPRWEREALHWKCSRPDLDNLIKLAKDALSGTVFEDDAQVVEIIARKIYGQKPGTVIHVTSLDAPEKPSKRKAA